MQRKLNVIILCECSQKVCKEFRKLGHTAYSCDIQDCYGEHPEWHLKMDAREALTLRKWDLCIAHPPCTFLSNAGALRLFHAGVIDEARYAKGLAAKDFFLDLLNADVPFIAVENPTPLRIFNLPECTQVIQPYMFGHRVSKRTLLWLKNLPRLRATDFRNNYEPFLSNKSIYNSPGRLRSETFWGVANAMAKQWSNYILSNEKYFDDEKIL